MPPLPRLRVAALRDLADQLRYASRAALLKDLDRIESLARTIDPDRLYPEDWLVHEVTGFRPHMDAPAQIVGEAVLYDLSALVERLSALAQLRMDELREPCATIEELCTRWRISRKSIDRYRKRGLIALRVLDDEGHERLAFPVRTVARFEREHASQIAAARRYTRIDERTREVIFARARDLCAQGHSLNEAALLISREIGRSHEGVRQILRRHDEQSDRPIFGERGPVSERERRIAFRAWQRGEDPARIARRLRRSTPSIRRAVLVERALRLHALGLPPDGPSTDLPEDGPAISWDLGTPAQTIPQLLALARAQGAPIGAEEHARSVALRRVLACAGARISRIRASTPTASEVDEGETLIRWALRLRSALVLSQMPTIVRTIEARLDRPLEHVRSDILRELLERAIVAGGQSVDAFDPSSGARLAARVGMGVDRAIAPIVRAHASELRAAGDGRALPKVSSQAPITDWQDLLAEGLLWLDLPARCRARMGELDPRTRAFLSKRYGLHERPATLAELQDAFDLSRIRAPRFERLAIRVTLRPQATRCVA